MSATNFNLDSYKKAVGTMIEKNGTSSYIGELSFERGYIRKKTFSEEEVTRIINSHSIEEQQKLSREFFSINSFYKRIIIHYATLLKNVGILIPNPSFGKTLSNEDSLQKRYFNALNYVEKMDLFNLLTHFSTKVLIDGCYYGIILESSKTKFTVLDLPTQYCRSRFKDEAGNDLIEFNVSYFNTILKEKDRKAALRTYPKELVSAYRKYKKGRTSEKWCFVPVHLSIYFSMFDGTPPFLNVISAALAYQDAVNVERERDLEEIRKIIVQKVPHLNDGGLLFEPDEAAEMHAGAVDMMRGNKNISVLTTYTDVDAITSKTSADTVSNNLEKMVKNIYYEGGVSSDIFSASGSSSLPTSLKNDLAFMMVLGNKYSTFISNVLNNVYGNGTINFTYHILPISYYNEEEVVNNTFKLAQSGYSLLIPAIAIGIDQKEFTNLKNLENDVLKLTDILIPPKTSYTQSDSEGVGRPSLQPEEKSEKTIANEKSIENTGQGGST